MTTAPLACILICACPSGTAAAYAVVEFSGLKKAEINTAIAAAIAIIEDLRYEFITFVRLPPADILSIAAFGQFPALQLDNYII